MSDQLFPLAEAERRGTNHVMAGSIASVDLAAGRARVEFDEDGWTSDALPWIEVRAGALRTWSPPTVGEQVLVLSPSGEPAAGFILRGIFSTAFPAPSADANLTRLIWADAARDDYDHVAHERTIELPAAGRLVLKVGGSTLTIEDGTITLEVGDSTLTVEDGTITLDADQVLLGPPGDRKAVARVGDLVNVTSGSSTGTWPIMAGSDAVKAA
jgi:phage baseplate assembly protein V